MNEERLICKNLTVSDGRLQFAGVDAGALAKKYGTPLYMMDEDRIREQCRAYREAVKLAFGERGRVLYASKACAFKRMYEIIGEEGLAADVVSVGEIYTAMKAGFPMEKAYFHSNNKTDEDIAFALENGVGCFVVDNEEELISLERIAGEKGTVQPVILRVTPGIDPHTFEAVATGKVDSKFGNAIVTGQAKKITEMALNMPHIKPEGFHCHVGSEVFESDVFMDSAAVMLEFVADIYRETGFLADVLDLGGGYGVRYTPDQPALEIERNILAVGDFCRKKAAELNIPLPAIGFEPGRSIVADAGLTLYTVGNVKTIPDVRTYVSVDGGMTDNIRYALYQAPYTLAAAEKMDEPCDMVCTVVGRCCESGDMIQENITLPSSMKRGDLLACFTTGAYHYSMASNYNRIGRLPVVMLREGRDYLAVKRESLDHLVALDV